MNTVNRMAWSFWVFFMRRWCLFVFVYNTQLYSVCSTVEFTNSMLYHMQHVYEKKIERARIKEIASVMTVAIRGRFFSVSLFNSFWHFKIPLKWRMEMKLIQNTQAFAPKASIPIKCRCASAWICQTQGSSYFHSYMKFKKESLLLHLIVMAIWCRHRFKYQR